jgi:hypothetical protein
MLIQFEGIDAPGDTATTDVPDGFGGMDWTSFAALDPAGSGIFIPSGFNNGIVSGTSVAANSFALPATFASQGADFELRKMYLTGAWSNDLKVTVEGYDDGILVARKSFFVDYAAPTKAKFGVNFASIDEVVISTSGGVDADGGDASTGDHVAIDDIHVRFEDVLPTRVGEQNAHFHAPHDGLADAGLDATGFSHWMFA